MFWLWGQPPAQILRTYQTATHHVVHFKWWQCHGSIARAVRSYAKSNNSQPQWQPPPRLKPRTRFTRHELSQVSTNPSPLAMQRNAERVLETFSLPDSDSVWSCPYFCEASCRDIHMIPSSIQRYCIDEIFTLRSQQRRPGGFRHESMVLEPQHYNLINGDGST
jgi:hypothetical protein